MANRTLATITASDIGSRIVILNVGLREGVLADARQIPTGRGGGDAAKRPVTMVRLEGYNTELHFSSTDEFKVVGADWAVPAAEIPVAVDNPSTVLGKIMIASIGLDHCTEAYGTASVAAIGQAALAYGDINLDGSCN